MARCTSGYCQHSKCKIFQNSLKLVIQIVITVKGVMVRNCVVRGCHSKHASEVHQKMLALSISIVGENNFFGDGIKLFNINKHLKVDTQETKWDELLKNNGIETIHLAKKFQIAGRTCAIDTIFLRKMSANKLTLPSFWRVAEITSSENKKGIGLIMELLETCYFEEDRFSYILKPKQTFSYITAESLVFKVSLQSFENDGFFHLVSNYYHIL